MTKFKVNDIIKTIGTGCNFKGKILRVIPRWFGGNIYEVLLLRDDKKDRNDNLKMFLNEKEIHIDDEQEKIRIAALQKYEGL